MECLVAPAAPFGAPRVSGEVLWFKGKQHSLKHGRPYCPGNPATMPGRTFERRP